MYLLCWNNNYKLNEEVGVNISAAQEEGVQD